jgi:hypothetical protein
VGVIAAKRDTFRDMTHTQKMYEYVAMHKPVVIAETPAVRTHFDESCFEFFTSDDPADLARALRNLYHNPSRAVEMIEAATCRYRAYAWEAQRHVYTDAILSVVPRSAPGRTAPQERERTAEANSATMVAVPVEPTPALAAMDWSGRATPIDDRGLYLSGMATQIEDRSI